MKIEDIMDILYMLNALNITDVMDIMNGLNTVNMMNNVMDIMNNALTSGGGLAGPLGSRRGQRLDGRHEREHREPSAGTFRRSD